MKIGLNFFPVTTKILFPVARRMDELGYESLWMGEHIVIPAKIDSNHPYSPELGPPLPSTRLHDPLILLAYVAAQTERLMLGTSVYLTALRHPLAAARMALTLDEVSGGRFLFGSGVGWLKEEFEALQVPWEHRGPRMDEALDVIRRLMSEERISHKGRFYEFQEVGFEPKPVNGKIPILIGGHTPIALKRAARIGDGWVGVWYPPEEAARYIAELAAMRGDAPPLEITLSSEGVPTLDEVRRYRDVGVHRLTFGGRMLTGGQKSFEAMIGGLERFAEEVIDRIDD